MPDGYDLPPEMPISRFVSPFVREKRRSISGLASATTTTACMKTRAELADELLKMIDAGVSSKQATEWLVSYEANFGTAMIAEIFVLVGTKLHDRAKEYEREVEQSRRKATRD